MSKETSAMRLTMAAASPEDLSAMYNFFNLLELLFDRKYGFNESEPADMEGNFPLDWQKEANRLYSEQLKDDSLPDDYWKTEMVKFAFTHYSISCGWRRVVGGFESLFSTFCVKDNTTLTYDTDTLVALIEQSENCTITRTPKTE